jgi:hypothetical protein
MTEDESPRRRGRPPLPDGQKPKRDIRIGSVWDDARAAAEKNGERFAVFVERALTREIQRQERAHRRETTVAE